MRRYLRLYGYFVRFSMSKSMEFRIDFFFRIVMDLLFYAVNLAFFKILFLHTSTLGGWNEAQTMIFISGYLVLDAINMTIFSNNIYQLPFFINRGDLDYYLVRPVSSLFFVSLRDFATNSFLNLVMALGILGWAISQYPPILHPARIAFFVLLLANGAVLDYSMRMILITPIFWTHSGRGLDHAHWTLLRLAERPDRIFTGWFRRVLRSLLPYALMVSFPTRLLLEEFDWGVLANVIGVTAVFFLAMRWAWYRGLRSYSSASS